MGSPNGWLDLLESQLPDLLELVVDTWKDIPNLTSDLEDKITATFCRELRKSRKARNLMFMVDPQSVELNPAQGQSEGRLDIIFRPTGLKISPDEEIYFCLECKRLNFLSSQERKTGAPEYVKDGMIRFINGQYAKSVKHGAMLGYVLDGKIDKAMMNVTKHVQKHSAKLCMKPPVILHPSSILTDLENARESFHLRQGETNLFTIHHIFVNADKLVTTVEDGKTN